jgi:DNA polymerase III delta prime subunit
MELLTIKYCPIKIDDFIGLENVKSVLKSFVANPYHTSWLFIGKPGTGKTAMAYALARELGVIPRVVPAHQCTVDKIRDIIEGYFWCDAWRGTEHGTPWERDVFDYDRLEKDDGGVPWRFYLMDEIDESTHQAQVALLDAIDPSRQATLYIYVFTANPTEEKRRVKGEAKDKGTHLVRGRYSSYPKLAPRFISRCQVLEFSNHGLRDDIAAFLAKIWQREAPPTAVPPNFTQIAKDVQNNIRDALLTLQTQLLRAYSGRPRRSEQLSLTL